MEKKPPDSGSASGQTKAPAVNSVNELQSTQGYIPTEVDEGVAAVKPSAAPDAPSGTPQSTQAHVPTQPPPAMTQAEGQPGQGKPSESKEQKISALGDYRLVKKLGEGGMGTVYKARQISLDRDAAVKILFKHLASNPEFVERFQREARIMAKLDHLNILRCYGVGEEKGFHYFAMEFIDGGSMQGWLEKLGKLSVPDALYVIIACARGLQHAHEQNIIHRDIKPDNILLTGKGIVKVADMGLAKAHGENVSVTRTGTGAGTPIYMSPEQARDAKHVDHRSDIYCLGCMLYTFLAGKPPFEGSTYVELFEAKEKGKFVPVRKSNLDVPERLDLMIDKMLAKKPEQRYQSCAELLLDLEGLGLAGSTLTFLKPAVPEPAKIDVKARAKAGGLTGASSGSFSGKKSGVGPASGKTAAPWDEERPDIWFLSFHTSKGKLLRRQLTTQQVRELIREDDFDLKAQASRDPGSGYRALATYPEFESALKGKIAKAKADHKTAKFHNMYQKLEEEERKRKRWRWFRDLFITAGGIVKLLIYLAVIGTAGFALIWAFRTYVMVWLNKMMGD